MDETADHEVLGATVLDTGTRFVVSSSVAERVELCLFDPDGNEHDHVDLERVDDTWRTEVAGVGAGQHYGYRVHGPGDPARGHACDPAKLLVDPAARRIVGDLRWTAELSTPGVDSAPYVPRSVVVAPPTAVSSPIVGRRAWDEVVAYEAHVGHLTARHPLVAPEARGRYVGLGAPVIVDHLQRLGVTAVELLPVQHFVSEQALVAAGERNVWGYNPLGWGAPHSGYATPGGDPVSELRAAVAELHAAGIEVWLDVVFNHTCEGSLGSGPILSWRGFDNAATYRLIPGAEGLVDEDVTGCGNAVDTRSWPVRRLIRELLVRWVQEFGIDGFRFDLGATLIRGDDGPTDAAAFLSDLRDDRRLDGTRLIAEPWDTGIGGYALGRFPEPWREWNDRFRDDVRDLWRGESPGWSTVASRLTASADAFGSSDTPRPPTAGVNAVATHDGFTLADLVSYEQPQGGGHGQRSSNSGLEGPTTDPEVCDRRARRTRAMFATLLCAHGVPMINSGDELGRTQGGRADGYTLDPASWGLPWAEADWDLVAFTAAAVALRQRHRVLRSTTWVMPNDPSVSWRRPDGTPLDDDAWGDPGVAGLQMVCAPGAEGESGAVILIAAEVPVVFEVPPGTWSVALDASLARGVTVPAPRVGPTVEVDGPGFVVLVDRP